MMLLVMCAVTFGVLDLVKTRVINALAVNGNEEAKNLFDFQCEEYFRRVTYVPLRLNIFSPLLIRFS